MTRVTLSTTSVLGDLRHRIEKISQAGFQGVELNEPDLTGNFGTAKEIGHFAYELGISIDVLKPFHDFEGLSGIEHEKACQRLEQKLALMHDLQAKTLLIGSSTCKDASNDSEKIIADMSKLAEHVHREGFRAAYIALPWAQHITKETEAYDIIKAVDHPSLGLALNSYFSLADGSQAAKLRDISGQHIFHVQLSDAPSLNFDISQLKSHFGLLPGQGGLNLESFIKILVRIGYQGPWSLARINSTINESRETFTSDGYRALISLLDEVAKSEPKLQRPLVNLPEKVHLTGFEFIEFAVDEKAQKQLTSMLASLSFRKERAHNSKSVELWRQGAINIVVNSEKKGLAAKVMALNGPCVCDMGLRVHDADRTVKRAAMLGAPKFSQPVGSGELDIPAIQGVGGSVVHFIDEKSDLHRVWDIEFKPLAKTQKPQPAGLRRIDHIAQTMRYQDMQSWLTYYLSTFQMSKADVVDVSDPSGIVLSQALSSPEGEVRLNLNGAGEQQTFAGAFLSNGFGAGVQHIAFSTDDIFETSDQLAIADFERLKISPNYYEDLKSRFQLPEDLIHSLKYGNILYDRDEEGEYFQLYSVPLWRGFFFEIVERRGGYQGYGAKNAPIRLAAQMHYINSLDQ